MKKFTLPSSIVIIGMVLMAFGIATTYVALGQESEQENPGAVVAPTLTPTVILENEVAPVVPAGEQSQPENAGKPGDGHGREQANIVQEVQPTIVAPVVDVTPVDMGIPQASPSPVVEPQSDVIVPQTVPATEVLAPDSNAIPTVIPATQSLEPPAENAPVDAAVEAGAENLTEEDNGAEVVAPDTTAIPTVQSIESPVENAPVDAAVEAGAENPTGEDNGAEVVAPDTTAIPTVQSIESPVENTPVATVVEVNVEEAQQPDLTGVTPAAVVTLEGEALPVQDTISAELAIAPEATEQIVIEASVEAEILPSFVLGQVDSRERVNVTLTLPTGEIVSQMADEQGAFQFEVLEQGEYSLLASAPGSLSRQLIFNLDVGQQIELPLTRLSLGDVNQDSHIDLSDIVLVAANYDGPALVAQADLNGDSWIDISDLTIIGAKFGLSGPLPWASP